MIRGKSLSQLLVFGLIGVFASTTLTGCFSGTTKRKRVAQTPVDPNDPWSSDPDPGDPNSPLQITGIFRNQIQPGSVVDVTGTYSGGNITDVCKPVADAAQPGATTCKCVFKYFNKNDEGDWILESFERDTLYTETNLLRCNYTGVPTDLGSFEIKIRVTEPPIKSNQVEAEFKPGNLDPTDWSTFAEVKRYQCRDMITIPNIFNGSTIYDPFLSDSTRLNYPLDFFTTNPALSHAAIAMGAVRGWDCPSTPNDPRWGPNLRVFSEAPDATGSYLIHPAPEGSFDRSKFHLARQRSGVFQTPVNSYMAPQTPTGEGGIFPPMGFGAQPLKNESCPNVSLPSGYRWVKVWLFRAALPPRSYKIPNHLRNVLSVGCNPGVYDTKPTEGVFEDCNVVTPTSPAGGFTFTNTAPDRIADRILGTNMCVKFTANNDGIATAPGFGGGGRYGSGTDRWIPRQNKNAYNCQNPGINDPLGLCQTTTPHDDGSKTDFTHQVLDKEQRFSFLYVVTPPEVTLTQMDSNSSVARMYYPFRFKNASDCDKSDPTQCPSNNALDYGLKLHDIAQNGDPPADDPERAGIFPVCALQPER